MSGYVLLPPPSPPNRRQEQLSVIMRLCVCCKQHCLDPLSRYEFCFAHLESAGCGGGGDGRTLNADDDDSDDDEADDDVEI